MLIDRKLLIKHKIRAVRDDRLSGDFLMAHVAKELADRLSLVDRRFERAVTLFCGSDHAARALFESDKVGEILRVELHAALLGDDAGLVETEERVPDSVAGADLVVSLLALHAINDMPGLLAQVRHALKPDGLFLAAFVGAGTLQELRESLLAAEASLSSGAGARVYPFTDVRDAGALLQRAGFALPVADIETLTVRYSSLFDLMRDIRASGESSALAERSSAALSRTMLVRASEHYGENFSDPDGRIRATFNIVWMSGWAPHASQQRPLRPGSAKTSLARTLAKIEGDHRRKRR